MLTYKNPWPMFTMGCLGDAAAASLMIDQTSCRWPATLFAGLNFSCVIVLVVNLRRLEVQICLGGMDKKGRTQPASLGTSEYTDICRRICESSALDLLLL